MWPAAAAVTVVSVDYRLAPEHPAPSPTRTRWRRRRWLVEHAEELDVDPAQVTVMGESAGGNLAALVALAGRDRARTRPGLARVRTADPASIRPPT